MNMWEDILKRVDNNYDRLESAIEDAIDEAENTKKPQYIKESDDGTYFIDSKKQRYYGDYIVAIVNADGKVERK